MRLIPLLVLLLVMGEARQELEQHGEQEETTVQALQEVEEQEQEEQEEPESSTDSPSSLLMTRGLRKTTRDAGGSLKLRCEVEGSPPATEFRWFKNEAPVLIERGRVSNIYNYHLYHPYLDSNQHQHHPHHQQITSYPSFHTSHPSTLR